MAWAHILLLGASAISLVVLIMMAVINLVGVEGSDDEVLDHGPFRP